MLVKFSSPKTESIIMFGDSALQLIRLLGASGHVPGAMEADDIPDALTRLEQGLQRTAPQGLKAASAGRDAKSGDDADESEPAVALATRAGPLLALLKRASAAHAPVMWEPLNSQ